MDSSGPRLHEFFTLTGWEVNILDMLDLHNAGLGLHRWSWIPPDAVLLEICDAWLHESQETGGAMP